MYEVLVPNSKEKLTRNAYVKREDDIKMNLKLIVWNCVEWIHLPQDKDRWQAFVNMVMNLQVH